MTLSPQSLLAAMLPQMRAAANVFVAYSGGLDSTALLAAAVDCLAPRKPVALHVDHGLSPHSGDWRRHCEQVCAGLGVHCRSVAVALEVGAGVESRARDARYQVFEQQLGEGDVLLMAHHLDDQAETLVYRLLRGAGRRGMAGIPPSRPLGKGMLLRPLLGISRAELAVFVESRKLSWVEDESNARSDVDRNFIRHEVLPAIARRWPDYRRRLATSAAQYRSDSAVLEEVAGEDLLRLGERREVEGFSVDAGPLAHLSRPRLANLLRHWALLRGFGTLGRRTPDALVDSLLNAAADAEPVVAWPGGQWRRFRRRLYLLPPSSDSRGGDGSSSPARQNIAVSPGHSVPLPDGTALVFEVTTDEGAEWVLAVAPGDVVELGFRRGGERCRPAGRQGSAALKKLLNEYGVAPWLRGRIPLLYVNGELAAVVGVFVCEGFAPGAGGTGVTARWQFPGGQNFCLFN